jgi:hypothetical protein
MKCLNDVDININNCQERKLLFVALFVILMLELFILLAVNKQVKVIH